MLTHMSRWGPRHHGCKMLTSYVLIFATPPAGMGFAGRQIMNMKPLETLSLLEEASGTKLYERKKDSAMKTLSKKQTKLDEIDEVHSTAGSAAGRCDTWRLGRHSWIAAHAVCNCLSFSAASS
eukprot:GHRQ01028725.1.p1 GENE.GHRQ01028725.1~~GHRQ01028725.1.p1  ORF type:complete len:136 (+),score=37.60 GHRQ01028725.1:42-410(+)